MPRDCAHDHCSFFLQTDTALCPGCGRSASPSSATWLTANHQLITWFAGGLGVVSLLVLLLAVFSVRNSLVVAIFMVAVAAAAMGFAFALRPSEPGRPQTTTIEGSYQQACDESRYWLERWTELFALAGQIEPGHDNELLLLREALSGAADAAEDAAWRRNDYASRLITNGFDRLDHLIATQPARPSPSEQARVHAAVAIVERYLETLWIDEHLTRQTRDRLTHTPQAQQQGQLRQLASSIRLLDAEPHLAASRAGRGSPSAVDLDAERFRLRAERKLLRESPLSEAEFFDDVL